MSLTSTLKRARKMLKKINHERSENTNQMFIYKENDQFDSNPAGALVIILKELETS